MLSHLHTRFPRALRQSFQDALTVVWDVDLLQGLSAARLAASILIIELGVDLPSYSFVDFCAGSGGPTPIIERTINDHLRRNGLSPVQFILTDLHPNNAAWKKLARASPHLTYESSSIDASRAPDQLVQCEGGKKVLRLFNLAFHHFDDPLARRILRDTVEKGQGFAIFELQDRSVSSIAAILLMGLGVILAAPFYAWKWRRPTVPVFTYLDQDS
ncbi:hypothetical protein CDD83_1813 [Cordyceps sp. RAO-2017]|nr:hypothetical protein CDD83_1813 [Cordyceps sp. RAO-2017]